VVKIVWDDTLPSTSISIPESEIDRWDRWFPLVGLSGEWEAIKAVVTEDEVRCNWARILELNRLAEKDA
jgi:hypothetical protein